MKDDEPEGTGQTERAEGAGARRAALAVQAFADLAAGCLALWIVLYSLGADRANPCVEGARYAAEGLGWWSRSLFTMDNDGMRLLLSYGLPAVLYLAIGHAVSGWLRRP
ncbi:hypothetical protein [Streptomyces sp. ODS28]|uniref:hypothetical protein n=1 Tax=Streptomyces sp. ODS28 TaxID=3136688 RepID=UPI0031EADC85